MKLPQFSVLNLGAGDLGSWKGASKKAGTRALIPQISTDLVEFDVIALLGVGAFAEAEKTLLSLSNTVTQSVEEEKRFLGNLFRSPTSLHKRY